MAENDRETAAGLAARSAAKGFFSGLGCLVFVILLVIGLIFWSVARMEWWELDALNGDPAAIRVYNQKTAEKAAAGRAVAPAEAPAFTPPIPQRKPAPPKPMGVDR